jgi:hypothetical protein
VDLQTDKYNTFLAFEPVESYVVSISSVYIYVNIHTHTHTHTLTHSEFLYIGEAGFLLSLLSKITRTKKLAVDRNILYTIEI